MRAPLAEMTAPSFEMASSYRAATEAFLFRWLARWSAKVFVSEKVYLGRVSRC